MRLDLSQQIYPHAYNFVIVLLYSYCIDCL